MDRKCGQCKHFLELRGGSNPLACCKDRKVIEFWDDKTFNLRLEVWPERDASTCAIYT